jgi:type III restriction enzyme
VRKECYQTFLRAGLTFSSSFFEEETEKFIDPQENIPFSLEKFSSKEVRRKAVDMLISFYSFSNLKKHFPRIKKLDEFILEKRFLGNIQVKVKTFPYQVKNRKPRDELVVALQVFKQISLKLKKEFQEYRGSKEFKQYPIKKEIRDKVLLFDENNEGLGKPMNTIDLSKKSWHVFNNCYGTSEEKSFVEYINEMESKILENWDEFYLIRNERFFKLYNFEDGEAFEPDYVLFLQSKNEHLYYQVFVEPKGTVWEED